MKYDPLLKKLGVGVPGHWYNRVFWFGNVAMFAFVKAQYGWLALSASALVSLFTAMSLMDIRMLGWFEDGLLDDEDKP